MRLLPGIILIISGLPAVSGAGETKRSMSDTARGLVDAANTTWGTPEMIQQNITRPMTSGEALTTPDGTAFDAHLGCGSKDAFLQLFVHPLKSGDLGDVTIKQDTVGDGEFDTVIRLPVHISGVCGNGFIRCKKGTWEDCQAYGWAAEDGVLRLTAVPMSSLGGCYCINRSCGTGLVWKTLPDSLRHLAAGAAAALARGNQLYAVTDIAVHDTVADVFGQRLSACDKTGNPVITDYTADPGKLKSDAFGDKDVNDIYQLIFKSKANTAGASESRACAIRRTVDINEVALDDIIDYDSGTGSVFPCGADCLQLVLGEVGDNYWTGSCGRFRHRVSFYVNRPDRIKRARLVYAEWDDWINVQINGSEIYAGPVDWDAAVVPAVCELSTNWQKILDVDFTERLATPGKKDFDVHVIVSGAGEGYARAEITVDNSCSLEDDAFYNTCTAWADDPECDLYEEIVDGVKTVNNFYRTGLKPLPETREVVGSSCSFTVKRDWFDIRRVYRCRGDKGGYTFDTDLDRVAYITETSTSSAWKDRITRPDGKPVYRGGRLVIPDDTAAVDDCVKACKTGQAAAASDVARSGVAGEQTVDGTRQIYTWKRCGLDGCPLADGEVILEECECLDQFGDAVAAMQSLRMAGSDTICTDGAKK